MHKKGFTLLEMLIVVAVLAALVLIFAPNSSGILNKGSAAKNSADLKSIGNVMFQYSLEHQALPLGSGITTTDPNVIAGIKAKLAQLGSTDTTADYTAISTHFKAIDNNKLTAYTHDIYDDYFLIDDTSPKMAGYVVSYKMFYAVAQTGQAIQFVDPNGIFATGPVGTTISLNTISTLSIGYSHTIATKQDGTLWSWGYNAYGQLGLNDTTDRLVPTQVGIGTTWASATTGYYHSLAIKQDGSLWSWGYNAYGQLGLNDTTDRLVPTQVSTGTTWASVSAGGGHSTMALKQDGSLWGFGDNSYGQLGLNDIIQRNIPTQVGTETTWASASITQYHTLAIKQDGSLWGIGYNADGELGLNDTVDRQVPTQVGTATWKFVATGLNHSFAIQQDGTLWGWGYNNHGQLGLNDTIQRNVPTQVGTATWKSVALGWYHTLAIQQNGTLWGWGENSWDQLGLNDATDRHVPTQVGVGTTWKLASAMYYHSIANKLDGTLWSWGHNGSGPLGQGDTSRRNVPTQVGIETTWK